MSFIKVWAQEDTVYTCVPHNTNAEFKIAVKPPNMEENICTWHLEVLENNTNYSNKELEELSDFLIEKHRNK